MGVPWRPFALLAALCATACTPDTPVTPRDEPTGPNLSFAQDPPRIREAGTGQLRVVDRARAADYTDSVTWTSSDPSVLLVSDAAGTKGLATGVREGEATVRVSLRQASATLTVPVVGIRSVAIRRKAFEPSSCAICTGDAPLQLLPAGEAATYTLSARYADDVQVEVGSDGSRPTWTTSSGGVLSVDSVAAAARVGRKSGAPSRLVARYRAFADSVSFDRTCDLEGSGFSFLPPPQMGSQINPPGAILTIGDGLWVLSRDETGYAWLYRWARGGSFVPLASGIPTVWDPWLWGPFYAGIYWLEVQDPADPKSYRLKRVSPGGVTEVLAGGVRAWYRSSGDYLYIHDRTRVTKSFPDTLNGDTIGVGVLKRLHLGTGRIDPIYTVGWDQDVMWGDDRYAYVLWEGGHSVLATPLRIGENVLNRSTPTRLPLRVESHGPPLSACSADWCTYFTFSPPGGLSTFVTLPAGSDVKKLFQLDSGQVHVWVRARPPTYPVTGLYRMTAGGPSLVAANCDWQHVLGLTVDADRAYVTSDRGKGAGVVLSHPLR